MATAVADRFRSISLLDVDPDLAAGISTEQIGSARRRSVATLVDVTGPEWDPAALCAAANDGWIGLYVVEGLLLRRVQIGRRHSCELLGGGDLFRPWDTDGDYDPLTISVDWMVRKPVVVAVLDTLFALRIAPWPSITSKLIGGVARRARYLSLMQAVTHVPRAATRVLMLFWLLAERWGTVRPDGVLVELPLTHEVVAMLAGTNRPTVTIALQRLAGDGLLIRKRSDRWLLTGLALRSLSDPEGHRLLDETRAPD